MDRPKSQDLVIRAITPLMAWAVAKLLEAPPVKERLEEVDALTLVARRDAERALRRAGRNAVKNYVWLAGGAIAIAVGIGMIARATRAK